MYFSLAISSVIFCLPIKSKYHHDDGSYRLKHTVTAGLDGSFDVTNALDGDTVLVVAVDVEILELSNLVQ